MTQRPLGAEADAGLLQTIRTALLRDTSARIGIAVSGGGDSTALLHLALRVAPGLGFAVEAVTVDHGLRPESAAEAAQVAVLCAAQGIPHATLLWQDRAATGNLMDQARRARFALISDWARGRGIGRVLLGHTADDQAESFLMNLGRVAGLDGLSGMRPQWQAQGILWQRPLLGQGRADLRDYLRRNGVAWIDDPSNDNDRFTRIKARQTLAALAPLGISVKTLAGTIANLSQARAALTRTLSDVVAAHVTEAAGALLMPVQIFDDLPPDLRRRLLSAAIRWMAGADYAPRESQLGRLGDNLAQKQAAMLGGVRFRFAADRLQISREPRAVMGAMATDALWDHRWQMTGPHHSGLTVAALGAAGLRLCKDWRSTGHNRDALLVSPAIWHGDRLVAAPLAQKSDDWQAKLGPSFGMFILSH